VRYIAQTFDSKSAIMQFTPAVHAICIDPFRL
jgi:hypothetical protein